MPKGRRSINIDFANFDPLTFPISALAKGKSLTLMYTIRNAMHNWLHKPRMMFGRIVQPKNGIKAQLTVSAKGK